MSPSSQAVFLIAFGGPASPREIRPFLERVTKGIPIPAARLEEVARHYEAVGGKSPLNEITFRQAAALRRILTVNGNRTPVFVGMRNSEPFFVDALKQMSADGIKRVLGFILSSHRSEASWERYQKNIAEARAELGTSAPVIEYCPGWHDHPLFIQTWAELVNATLAQIPVEQRDHTPLIFTAHSLPTAMAAKSPYAEQLETTVRLVIEKLHHKRWSIAYQSRSGGPSEAWLEPDIAPALQRAAAEGCKEIIIAPIGFVCDHVEVLYDLDIEARRISETLGLRFHRVSCPNDHPTFIRMIAGVIEQKLKSTEDRG